jgi:rhamnose utilization protein RhaD (predicted bifunctional aldolase and dehydrogenase)
VDRTARAASQESPFHAWLLTLPGVNFVAHCHPDAILQIVCSQAAERFAEHRMFPDEVDFVGSQAVYVPYADAGTPLAREIRSKLQLTQRRAQSRTPKLILLQNHGAIAIGPTARAVLGTMLMAEKAARVFIGASRLGGPLFLPPQYVARLEGRANEGPRASTIKL